MRFVRRAIAMCMVAGALVCALGAVTTQPATQPAAIGPPPQKLALDPFYQKYTDANGLPVVSSAKVSDYALLEAAFIVNHMLEGRPDVREAMIEQRMRVVVMAYNEYTTDIPEHRNMTPKKFWDKRARGLGASPRSPVVSCAEENLLGYSGDPYKTECILVHEFGHAIHAVAMNSIDPTFTPRLRELYRKAIARGLWKDTYAGQNAGEYWAEGVQSWFDTNRPRDAIHNGVDTREKLMAYDPDLAGLLKEVFPDVSWRYQRPDRRSDPGHLRGFDREHAPTFAWPAELLEPQKRSP